MKHFKLVASSNHYRFRRATLSGLGSLVTIGPTFSRSLEATSDDALREDARTIGNDMKIAIEDETVRFKKKMAY